MITAILPKFQRMLLILEACGVDMELVYDLAGPCQLDTVLKIVWQWQELPHLTYTTHLARMWIIMSALEDGGIEDDDRRTDI